MAQSFCVFGGAHIDRIGTFETEFHLGQSHPGSWSQGLGGVAANIASHLQRFSKSTVSFAGLFGNDTSADWVRSQLAISGLDIMTGRSQPRQTPSYTALHDREGNVVAGLSDMALYQQFDAQWAGQAAEFAKHHDVWIADANISSEALKVLGSTKQQNKLIVVAVSPAKMKPIKQNLKHLDGLICNLEEAREILDMSCVTAEEAAVDLGKTGLRQAVVTDGTQPCACFDIVGSKSTLVATRPAALTKESHLTGAGDAFAAAFLYSAYSDVAGNSKKALKRAVNCAKLAVQQPQTCPSIEWQDICDMEENLA